MIADLDRTLEALLRRDLPNGLSDQVTISFAPPDGDFPPQSVSLPAIDLFLYDIRENRELRQNERMVSRGNGAVTIARAPIRVDCSYLITAWASDSAPNPPEDEHQLLGLTMMILLSYASLPGEVQQGALVGQTPITRTAALHPGHLQSLGEFWQALGGKPKAALNYTVTISVEPFASGEAPVVRQRILGGAPDIEFDE